MSTQGAPSKYTYCVAENEEENPWQPLHVERGFRPDQSTVTVLAGEPPHNINDHTGRSGDEILTLSAGAMAITGANNAYTGGETLLALGPEHAATMARDGMSKADVVEWLRQRALIPLERYTHDTLIERFGAIPDGPVPMVRHPEDLAIIVLGGPGKHSSWIPTFGGTTHSVTKLIPG
jgi:quercetin dioxygenase-like cupin family protein